MRVQNMLNSKGNRVANQFILNSDDGKTTHFQSYDTIIVQHKVNKNGEVKTTLDKNAWDYSKTTARYRNLFLGETTEEIKSKLDAGVYRLKELN